VNDAAPQPPVSRRERVVETLHGHVVADPFRWLEDGDSAQTRLWIDEQNARTRGVLDALPGRDRVAARLEQLLAIGDITLPEPRQGRYFFERRDGLQNQAVLYMRDGSDREQLLIDPNSLNSEGTTALDWWYPSQDGHLLCYGLSQGGDERSTLRVLDIDAGLDLRDQIANTRAASVAWLADSTGFYYTRYPSADDVPAGEDAYHRHVYCHHLGTDPSADTLIFGEGRDPTDWPSVSLSPDGRYLFVTVSRGWDQSDCYLRLEAPTPGPFMPVIENEAVLSSGHVFGGTVYLLTNLDAPRYRLFAIDPLDRERSHWREIVPEHPEAVLEDAHVGGGRLLLTYLERATSRLELRTLTGEHVAEVPLPGIGSVAGITGEWESNEAFFSFASFTVPPTIQRYDIGGGGISTWASIKAPVPLHELDVRQLWYPSRDGTQISMFVIARHDLPMDGSSPAVLTGYGGFNISMTPSYSRALAFWLERGGVYAVPNLRGGGEYGEAWHAAGMLEHKQNVFDDFIAAAEFLCASGFTSTSRLSISGGSNGGLLVGAAITQRPDLFRAAVCAVPLLDMLRYHQFQLARLWIAEYGCSDDPAQFECLWRYSPYHHVTDGVAYPAVLLLSGESDTRVDPLHARKMAARLQEATSSGLPVLLRIETNVGHGAGRPLAKTLAEQTDIWTFLCWQLGVPLN